MGFAICTSIKIFLFDRRNLSIKFEIISNTVECRWYAIVMNDYIDNIESRFELYRILSPIRVFFNVVR